MAAVEEGEILELDKDEVIDLCSDAEPSPQSAHLSSPNDHVPGVSRATAPFSRNTYRGGDPFLGSSQSRDDVHNPSVGFSRLNCSPASFHRTHDVSGSVSDRPSHLHASVPHEEPLFEPQTRPNFERDPYATNCNTPSAIQKSIPEASHMPILPHSFLSSSPSSNSVVPPPLTMVPPQQVSWPRPAPPDPSPSTFGRPSESQVLNPQHYDPEHANCSPSGDQTPFSDTPVFHAEPAPQPSPYFGMQHPPVPPMNAGLHQNAFGASRGGLVHSDQHLLEGSHGALDVYANGVATEHAYPSNTVLHPSSAFTNSALPYQGMHEVQSPLHRVSSSELHERKGVYHGRFVQPADLGVKSRDPNSSNQQYLLGCHQKYVSGSLVTEHATHNGADEESRRKYAEPVTSSFSDEEDGLTKAAETQKSCDGYHTAKEAEFGSSQRNATDAKNQIHPPPSQETSEGEINSPCVASPVISVATAPDETPSPPSSTKKKPANIDTKKHLSELRKKALMSVKKRSAARTVNETVSPISSEVNLSPAASTQLEVAERQRSVKGALDPQGQSPNSRDLPLISSDELAPGFKMHSDPTVQIVVGGVSKTMTQRQHAEWQAWPYQNRVVVEYSSDSDNDGDDAGDDDDYGSDDIANITGEAQPPERNREREIESMKIRMIRLGKCPSMLFGGINSSNDTKHLSFPEATGTEEDKTGLTKGNSVTPKDIVPNQAQRGVPVTCEPQQISSQEYTSSPEQSDASEPKIASVNGTHEEAISTAEKQNETKVMPLSLQKAVKFPLPEKQSSLELLESAKQEPRKSGSSENNTRVQDEQVHDRQNKDHEKKDSVKGPRPTACSSDASSITELKRRIAAIEKSREDLKQHRQKKQKTVASQEVRANDNVNPAVEHKNLQRDGNEETVVLGKWRTSSSDKTERDGAQGANKVLQRHLSRSPKRYYSSGTSEATNKNLSQRIFGEKDPDRNTDQAPSSDGPDAKGHMSEKLDIERDMQLPNDNVERRYIDDLKLELEQKTKELINERDRTEQLRTAEVAIAEAQAKLNFTRSRVSALRDELGKAERDVLAAEKEYQQRARVVSQLRFGDADSSDDIVSREERANSRLQLTEDQNRDVLGTVPGIATENVQEEDMRQEEDKAVDFVVRPSPYSPSAGDNFTSCLRTLRAYLLRIPHLLEARDRIVGGILSSTWGTDLDPMKAICPQELRGQCSNKECEFQHLKVFKAPKDRALQVIQVIEGFFSREDRQKEEKSIINARIAIHEGKDAIKTLSSLISTLCASSKAIPYCSADI